MGKVCIACKIEKPLDDFSKRAASPDGRQYQCRACQSAYITPRAMHVPKERKTCSTCKEEKTAIKFAKSSKSPDGIQDTCRACCAEYRRNYRRKPLDADQKAAYVSYKRRWAYGITPDKAERMFAAQGERCAICGDKISFAAAHLDHDHETSVIRGFLCAHCNLGLGHFRDDPQRLTDAIDYLNGARHAVAN